MKEENKTGKTKNKWKGLNLHEYLLLVSMSFLFAGFGIFTYVILSGFDLFHLKWFNDPVLFFGIGFTILVCYLLQKKYNFFSGLDVEYDDSFF